MHFKPMVSVIIPVYNGDKYLGQAVTSVLAQTYNCLEVIVVDDGSTDETSKVAQSFDEIHYVYQKHSGVAAARNRGIAVAKGQYIAFLDSDDKWVPHRLALKVKYLLDRPQVDCAFCRITSFHDDAEGNINQKSLYSLEEEKMTLITMVAKMTVFDRIGGFDTNYRVGSDFEWTLRAKDAGLNLVVLPYQLVQRRIHNKNLSHQVEARRAAMLRMFRASIERQRLKNHSGDKCQAKT